MATRDRPVSPLRRLPAGSMSDRIADQLRTAIRQGTYAPGARLVERRLTAEFGVSHIPVREALERLIREGLVERLPRRGCRVATLTAKELDDVYHLRVVLEQHVAERAQQRWTKGAERELRRIVEHMRAAAGRNDNGELSRLDLGYHERLYALADSPNLQDVVTQLRARIDGFLRAANAALEPAALTGHAASHGDLLDAIASGDPVRARSAMAAHVTDARDRIVARVVLADTDEPGAAPGRPANVTSTVPPPPAARPSAEA